MKWTRDDQYKQVCKEIRDLKIFLGLSRVSDEDILGSTPVLDDTLSPVWVFNMKELIRLIKKKQEYDSYAQQPACKPAMATIYRRTPMGFLSDLFGYSKEVQDLVHWICEHDTYEYCGSLCRGYGVDEYYYNYSVDSLKHIKEEIMQRHAKLEYDKKHPKPKIGDVYSVYLCGKCVDTLRNVTNVSHNENGVFFTITLEDGTTRLKSYFGSGNIHWCKEG